VLNFQEGLSGIWVHEGETHMVVSGVRECQQ